MGAEGGLSRRQFLAGALGAGAAGAAGLVLARQPDHAPPPVAAAPLAAALPLGPPPTSATVASAKGILVLIGLYGGNDGLNTLIPYEDGHYLGGRATLGYQPDQVLPLADGLGLHPNLTGLKALWDGGHLAIVRGVGYPEPNRSHFRSMDIWQTATPSGREITGWVGRWLDRTGSDPLRAVAVSPNLPRALAGEKSSGVSVPVTEVQLPGSPGLAAALSAMGLPSPGESALAARAARSGADLVHVQTVMNEVRGRPGSAGDGPAADPGTGLSAQLDLVARSIRADVPTRVYSVSLSGFDTHADEKGTHAGLLAQLDRAITAFFASLQGAPQADQVVVMTYSEFGRRVNANGSGGTDHGTAAPMFVAGPLAKGGFYGEEPSLTDLDDGDLKFTTDFRSVYATALDHLLGMDPKDVLGKPFPDLEFL